MMTTQPETTSKAPSHTAFVVKPKEGEKSDWMKVGAMWEHSDKAGFNLSLNILGQDVMITIRKYKPKDT